MVILLERGLVVQWYGAESIENTDIQHKKTVFFDLAQ